MKIVVLVIDSFGIGELPDASAYGDVGSNTAGHVAADGPVWPNLRSMGLGNAAQLAGHTLAGCGPVDFPTASFGIMGERSPGKDTTTGHWELAGVVLEEAFTTFPGDFPSFPSELLDRFTAAVGRSVIGNRAASGTAIIEELGEEHLRSGDLIVYTSGDSVFQIAAHEEVVPTEELYAACEKARSLCDAYRVGRVIARPFVGRSGGFTRTSGRRDFSMEPPGETILDLLSGSGIETVGVGKIGDIFTERGIDVSHHDKGNRACLDRTEALLRSDDGDDRLIFVNLVDTDMIYGHRRDPKGYADAVSEIDSRIPAFLEGLADGDVLVITADHGCDPTFRGTDHTREHVPVLWHEPGSKGSSLGVRNSFADVAQSVVQRFGLSATNGESFFP